MLTYRLLRTRKDLLRVHFDLQQASPSSVTKQAAYVLFVCTSNLSQMEL